MAEPAQGRQNLCSRRAGAKRRPYTVDDDVAEALHPLLSHLCLHLVTYSNTQFCVAEGIRRLETRVRNGVRNLTLDQ